MSRIEAIYRHGVFEPLAPVHLCEEQRVQLSFEATGAAAQSAWLDQIRAMHAAIVQRQGVLPDSAADIAADRLR